MKQPAPAQRPPPWPQLILAAVVLVTFGRLVMFDFLRWDDLSSIGTNPHMNPPSVASLVYPWTHTYATLYVPVTYNLWTLLAFLARIDTPDRYGSTLNPMVYHGFNVLLHLVNTLMVFAIVKRLLRNQTAALLGALIYAVHPVQVEAVGWVSGTKDLLWGCFSFAAILLYLRFTDPAEPRRRLWYALGMLSLALAMLSKPTAMVTPAIVIAIDALLLKRRWRKVAFSAGPWLLLSLPCMIVARAIQTGFGTDGGPLWARPLIVLDSLAFYVGKLVWPLKLALDHGHRVPTVLANGELAWTWIVPVTLAALAFWQFRRRPWIVAGMAVFVLGVLPMLGAFPFSFQYYSTTADHYLYVSMLGVALIVAGFAVTSRPMQMAVVAVIVLLAGRSIWQAGIWRDTRTVFTHTLAVTPKSFVAELQLATEDIYENDPAAAEPRLARAVQIAPDFPRAHLMHANALIALHREDEAMAALQKSVDLESRFPPSRRASLADRYKDLGRYYLRKGDRAKAAQMLQNALREDPTDMEAAQLLART